MSGVSAHFLDIKQIINPNKDVKIIDFECVCHLQTTGGQHVLG